MNNRNRSAARNLWILIARMLLIGIAALLVFLWCVTNDRNYIQSGVPAHVDLATHEERSEKSTPAIIIAAPFSRSIEVILHVKDTLTGTALPGITVQYVRPDGRQEEVITKKSGECALQCMKGKSLIVRLEWNLCGTKKFFEATIEPNALMADDKVRMTAVVLIPWYACVRVHCIPEDGAAPLEWALVARVTGLPPVPATPGLSAGVREHLEQLRNSSPEVFARVLPSPSRSLDCPSATGAVIDGISALIPIAFEGEVYVNVHGEKSRPTGISASVRAGSVAEVSMTIGSKPVVRGRVTRADGAVVAGVTVHVTFRSVFGPNEFVPRAESEHPNPAFVFESPVGGSKTICQGSLPAITDDDGIFLLYVPFTDRLMVWTAMPGWKRVVAFHASGSRNASVLDADVKIAQRASPEESQCVVSETGEPVKGTQFRLIDRRNGFQAYSDESFTDAQGCFDAGWLEQGVEYEFWDTSFKYQITKFRHGTQQPIRVVRKL